MTYKYPLAKVKSFVPKNYRSVITELFNTHPEADRAQFLYSKRLLNMIVQVGGSEDFIVALTQLIKCLAVGHMHIVWDFFDRGNRPDTILDMLLEYHSLDIQWGNHDILWMGAACGSEVCIAGVVRNSLRYKNTEVLEKGYAISLRPLTMYAQRIYPDENALKASEKAISMIMFKLEGQLILRNPDFRMESRLQLQNVDYNASCYRLNGKRYELSSAYFPTVDPKNPYELTEEEKQIIGDLKSYFIESERLRRHVDFIYKKGSVYTCCNQNLLFHGCVPLNWDGTLKEVTFDGRNYKGKEYMDYCDQMARRAQSGEDQRSLDFMWFLWNGLLSPISGREFTTFERMFLEDESTWKEPSDPYYELVDREEICEEDPDLKPIDGIPELLDRLKEKGYRIGLGSSSVMANIQLVLGCFGILDYFDAIAAGSEVENAKPAPDVYLLAASRLGIAPENCTVVEDATAGIVAAKAAGMRCIAVRNPNSGAQDFSQADEVIDRYAAIKL